MILPEMGELDKLRLAHTNINLSSELFMQMCLTMCMKLSRRLKFEEEDRKLLEKLQSELDTRQRERDYAEKQRRLLSSHTFNFLFLIFYITTTTKIGASKYREDFSGERLRPSSSI